MKSLQAALFGMKVSGFRSIFGDNSHISKRIVWIWLLITAAVLAGQQSYDRVSISHCQFCAQSGQRHSSAWTIQYITDILLLWEASDCSNGCIRKEPTPISAGYIPQWNPHQNTAPTAGQRSCPCIQLHASRLDTWREYSVYAFEGSVCMSFQCIPGHKLTNATSVPLTLKKTWLRQIPKTLKKKTCFSLAEKHLFCEMFPMCLKLSDCSKLCGNAFVMHFRSFQPR